MAVLGAVLGGGMDLLGGVVDQVGSGLREKWEGERAMERLKEGAAEQRTNMKLDFTDIIIALMQTQIMMSLGGQIMNSQCNIFK